MSEFERTTIGNVCSRFSSGDSIRASDIRANGKYPVYGGNGLRGYTDQYNFDGECAVIGRQGAKCGNVHYVTGKSYLTEHAIVTVANENNSTGYLAYKLGLMDLGKYQGQSAQPGLSVTTLADVELLMPKKAEQNRIFEQLNLIDQAIENNKVISSTLESLAKTIYDYWFVQFDFPDENGKPYKSSGGKMVWNEELKREIPEGWEVRPFGSLCTFMNGINYDKNEMGDKTYQIVNVRNITASSLLLDDSDFDYITLKASQADRYLVNDNDILIARSGSPGACRLLMSNNGNTIFCGFIIRCAPRDTKSRFYLAYFLKRLEGSNATKTGGSILQNVSQETLSRLNVFIPTQTIINAFNDRIISLHEMMQACIVENQNLVSLRDFLLPMLMNGQVTVQEKA